MDWNLQTFLVHHILFLFRYKGGPVLARKMISAGDSKQFHVEVFPLSLTLVDSADKSESILRLSKKVLPCVYFYLCYLTLSFLCYDITFVCMWFVLSR